MRWDEVKGSTKPRKLKKLSEIAPSRAKKAAEKIGEQHLEEGRKFIKVGHEQIGVDKPHHNGQQEHAHLPNGRAVNKDGSLSHGGDPFTMKKSWVDALRGHNFSIAKSRLVESDGDNVTVELDAAVLEFLAELQAYLSEFDD
jgi:hypothetical protein